MTPMLDLERFQLPAGWTAPLKPKQKPPRFCKTKFLRGPIPWAWIVRAMALPGRALAVGLILWRESGIRNSLTVPLQHAHLRDAGILSGAARRGMRYLEKANLVMIRRRPGRCLEVTILDGLNGNGKR
jgi:hypothetical protein